MNSGANIDPSGSRASEDTLRLMQRVGALMFVVGGLTCLSGIWILQSTPDGRATQAAVSGALLVTGTAVSLVRRPSRLALEVAVWWSILLIGVLIAGSDPVGMAPLFYLWPVVYVAYFSSVRVVIATYAWMVVSLAVALAANPTHDLKLDTFTGTVTSIGIMAALIATMTNQQTKLRDKLAVAAETDPLTGLLNRRSFNPHLEVLVADAVAQQRKLAVVMVDIDHFKHLNDERGHLIGDRALQEVAATLRSQSREHDLVSRFGGEEFAIALPGADLRHARAYTERVAARLRGPDMPAGLEVAFSAGISSLTHDTDSAELLMKRADEALYAAKGAGRGRCASWQADGIVIGDPYGQPIGS